MSFLATLIIGLAPLYGCAKEYRSTIAHGATNSSSLYDAVRRDIESAGRQGDFKELTHLIDTIDHEIARSTFRNKTVCWHLLKGAALVELGRLGEAKAIFEALNNNGPVWQALNNLGVLEAADGEFDSARLHLLRAIEQAEADNPGEENLPQGNLRNLLARVERPSLTLAGSCEECAAKQRLRVDCLVQIPVPEVEVP